MGRPRASGRKSSGSTLDPREQPSKFYPYIEQGTWDAFSGRSGLRRSREQGNERGPRYGMLSGRFDEVTITPRELALALETPALNAEDALDAWLEPAMGMSFKPRLIFPSSVLEAERRISAARSDVSPLALRRTLMTWVATLYEHWSVEFPNSLDPIFYKSLGRLALLDQRLALWCASSLISALVEDEDFQNDVIGRVVITSSVCALKLKTWLSSGDDNSRDISYRSIDSNLGKLERIYAFYNAEYYQYMESEDLEADEDYTDARDFYKSRDYFRYLLQLSRDLVSKKPRLMFRDEGPHEYEADKWDWVFAGIGAAVASPQVFLAVLLESIETFPAEPSRLGKLTPASSGKAITIPRPPWRTI